MIERMRNNSKNNNNKLKPLAQSKCADCVRYVSYFFPSFEDNLRDVSMIIDLFFSALVSVIFI